MIIMMIINSLLTHLVAKSNGYGRIERFGGSVKDLKHYNNPIKPVHDPLV